MFGFRVVDDVTGLVQHRLTLGPDLCPDLLDSDGFTVNLRHLLALLPRPRLEAGHLALLLLVQHTWIFKRQEGHFPHNFKYTFYFRNGLKRPEMQRTFLATSRKKSNLLKKNMSLKSFLVLLRTVSGGLGVASTELTLSSFVVIVLSVSSSVMMIYV